MTQKHQVKFKALSDETQARIARNGTLMTGDIELVKGAEAVLKAEAMIVMLAVKNISFKFIQDLCSVLRGSITDSDIIRGISLGATKVSYLLRYGLYTYFHDQLLLDIQTSLTDTDAKLTIGFDETTNKQVKSQLDIIFIYWSNATNQVED